MLQNSKTPRFARAGETPVELELVDPSEYLTIDFSCANSDLPPLTTVLPSLAAARLPVGRRNAHIGDSSKSLLLYPPRERRRDQPATGRRRSQPIFFAPWSPS